MALQRSDILYIIAQLKLPVKILLQNSKHLYFHLVIVLVVIIYVIYKSEFEHSKFEIKKLSSNMQHAHFAAGKLHILFLFHGHLKLLL
jgi:hypothetical protein